MAKAPSKSEGALARYENAGPAALAKEPSKGKPNLSVNLEWQAQFQHLERRLAMLRSWRLSWIQHYALLASYILPRRSLWLAEGGFDIPVPNAMVRGLPINENIVDPTGTLAMRVCANGIMSGLTSPSRPWFKLKPAQEGFDVDQDVKAWFDETENRIYEVMAGSNFYDSIAQMDEDLVTYGTAPVILYEDATDILRCYNPCAGEYYLAVGASLRVESFFRLFTQTVTQMVEMFGVDACPQDVQEKWREKGGSLETEFIVAHCIEPNFEVEDAGRLPGFTWRETYWLYGRSTPEPLSRRGFNECPFIAPRWAVTSNDAYGRSPAMDALPDVIQLQVETKRKAEAIEKQVRPPLLASAELKNEPSSILPGHVTYVANLGPQSGMRPIYEVQPELQYMSADILAIQQRIQKGFFNDLFLMLSEATKEMTAFEVAQRQQEKLQVLGPVIERLQNEALSPAIKRIYAILARKNLLPPAPPALQQAAIKIEYISMMALAQRAAATASMERVMAMAGQLKAADPANPNSPLDLVDDDEFLREYGDMLSVPTKIFRSQQQVQAIRQQRAQAAQQQAGMQNAMAMVEGAKTLGQVNVGGGMNAVQAMLGGAGPAPGGGA